MKKILFPTDFSDTANNALEYALNLAERFEAVIYVLHVYQNPITSGSVPPKLVQDARESTQLKQLEYFRAQVPKIRQLARDKQLDSVEIQFILKEGLLNPTIKQVIQEEEIKLLIMGTNGLSALEKIFFGSNTANALTSINIPILCIPKQSKYAPFTSIGFTTLFSPRDEEVLDELLPLANKYQAQIQCININLNEAKTPILEIERWKHKYASSNIQFHLIEQHNIEKGITSFIEEETIELLVSVARSKNFIEKIFSPSLTKKLSHHSKIPILIYH